MEDRMEAIILEASIHVAELDRIAQRAARIAENAAQTIARVAALKNGEVSAAHPQAAPTSVPLA